MALFHGSRLRELRKNKNIQIKLNRKFAIGPAKLVHMIPVFASL